MLSAVDGHVCNLAVNGPCIYIGPTATDVVQYIDFDILAEVSTLARLKAGHGDELTWQLMLLVTAWAMLSQISQNLDIQDVTKINVPWIGFWRSVFCTTSFSTTKDNFHIA